MVAPFLKLKNDGNTQLSGIDQRTGWRLHNVLFLLVLGDLVSKVLFEILTTSEI